MISIRGLVSTLNGWLGKPMATPETDPQRWFGMLMALPNPDPILRNMGQAEKVYRSILADPHVIGDVRSIRGNFRSFDWRLTPGKKDDPASAAARDLCAEWLQTTPPGGVDGDGIQLDWQEVMWQMTSAIFSGYRVHEVVWGLVNGQYLPTQVLDRPNRRIMFNAAGSPMLVSVANALGAPIDQPSQFVISRHMPDSDNPYGVALLSSCFWAWTFKTGGWRYFVKYCERHGLPWPIGRYPQGASEAEQDKLAEALGSMMEAGYVVAQEGTSFELLAPSVSTSSNLPQQSLIDLCNREMSKALTGQAMVAELHGTGSRAASQTADGRQDAINASDRHIAAASMNQIFRWITLYNFGPGVAPPSIEFFLDEPAGLERAQTYQTAADVGARPSRSAMLSELGMPAAKDDADALLPSRAGQQAAAVAPTDADGLQLRGGVGLRFARESGLTDLDALQLATQEANQAIADHMIKPVYELLKQYERDGKTLQEFSAAARDVFGAMDDEALRGVIERALTFSILRGAATDAE